MTKEVRNPLGKFMAGLAFTVFGLSGLAALTDRNDLLAPYALPMIVACSATFTVWTILQQRTGSMPIVGKTGLVSRFRRDESPIMFWLLFIAYLAMGALVSAYLGYALVSG